MMKFFNSIVTFQLLLLLFIPSLSYSHYASINEKCDGLPKLPIGSMDGTCIGLIASNQTGVNFTKPRKAIEIAENHQLLVTDMGGWTSGKGVLWLLQFESNQYANLISQHKVATKLALPHDIKRHKDGFIYLGEAHQISRFKIKDRKISDYEVVIGNLPPPSGKYLHPLTSFVFLNNNDLLINVGSKTDDCGLLKGQTQCSEINDVGLRHYTFKANNTWDQNFTMYATGLRNSVALVVHNSGTILQGENSADLKDADEPYEEINHIKQGAYYGWPYCLNRQFAFQASGKPAISQACQQPHYTEPYSLMPPHVAPLDMIYYHSKRLPMLNNQLIMSWHGYRVIGNRIVSYAIDNDGLPILSKSKHVQFHRDPIAPATQFTQHKFNPTGGSQQDAQHTEVISHWNQVPDLRPEGAPVGLLQLKDGTILIVDDKNKSLLRLSSGKPYKDTMASNHEVSISGYDFSGQQKDLLLQQCADCHTELHSNPGILLNHTQGWLSVSNNRSLLETKLTNDSGFMPPTGKLTDSNISIILKGITRH